MATNDRTRFIGNINIGTDITFQELRDAYHAVVLCYGSSQDAMLNIPGESLGNVILIKDFLQKYSTNILRLLCIRTHYRSGKFFVLLNE